MRVVRTAPSAGGAASLVVRGHAGPSSAGRAAVGLAPAVREGEGGLVVVPAVGLDGDPVALGGVVAAAEAGAAEGAFGTCALHAPRRAVLSNSSAVALRGVMPAR
ncbi:MAG TPA: hypothetical protein VNB94_06090 [Mycobacteriales bacterium]|nr:hypothetical protein [Mycobacteriales bacterium]